ncbi:hypothetical protein CRUP_030265 [Coryphaenoides rupestris]|nr:hypothetical protein CRUP_030265 [Coryphaenoides rupestris]
MMGLTQPGTSLGMFLQMMASRNTVPPRMFRMVPLGRAPHLLQLELVHAILVRRDGGALDAHAVALHGGCRLHRHPSSVASRFSMPSEEVHSMSSPPPPLSSSSSSSSSSTQRGGAQHVVLLLLLPTSEEVHSMSEVWKDQLLLDELPDDPSHLVSLQSPPRTPPGSSGHVDDVWRMEGVA